MSTGDLLGEAVEPIDHQNTERQRLLRIAGRAGLGVFAAWLCQPLLVFLLADTSTDVPTMSTLESMGYVGTAEVIVFSLIGACQLTLVLATWRVMRLAEPVASVASTVGLVMGIVGAAGWFWTAGDSLALYTSVGAGLGDVTDDAAVQAASLQASYVSITGGLIVFAIGSAGWYVGLLTAGRRTGLVGTPLALVLALLLAAPVFQLAVPFSAPWALIAFVLGSLVLGIGLLLSSRKGV